MVWYKSKLTHWFHLMLSLEGQLLAIYSCAHFSTPPPSCLRPALPSAPGASPGSASACKTKSIPHSRSLWTVLAPENKILLHEGLLHTMANRSYRSNRNRAYRPTSCCIAMAEVQAIELFLPLQIAVAQLLFLGDLLPHALHQRCFEGHARQSLCRSTVGERGHYK
jgi:hypothetical protein